MVSNKRRSSARGKKVLCLGVSYADVEEQCKKLDWDARRDWAADTVDAAVQCVQRGLLTQMDGRDLARCRSTEKACQCAVYTVSQERGAIYRSDRHLTANFNRRDFARSLQDRFGSQFDQVILDYFWIPAGWDANHWTSSFFQRNLVSFAKDNLLKPTGAIYLPFCFHCFKQVLIGFPVLRKYYNISFLRKGELDQIALWKGTQQINEKVMQGILGKHLTQEDTYCTFGPRDVCEAMDDPAVSKEDLVQLARSLENFGDIRFMRLDLLPSTAKVGQFLGCIDPSKVKRGFDQMGLAAPPSCSTPASTPKRVTTAPPRQQRRKATPSKLKVTVVTPSGTPRRKHKRTTTPSRALFAPPQGEKKAAIAPNPVTLHRYATRSRSVTPCSNDEDSCPVEDDSVKCKRRGSSPTTVFTDATTEPTVNPKDLFTLRVAI
jgi:hypothetical protein